ncbi:MAG: hypothetical protein A2W91_14795 [Bacteroidetes bacterium GWF2_38_335]|nr:MAG: hypothetical protein A2W91_14795 [Bacteroidetes bacterium GWF2_38_335]OFY78469.1 MAG: hypothetical protein A2281_16105 [Bacteroidetes bacterium RIFOXYA12_FULL_38_20]HBS88416.1 hypothetical protein [Bacteroidales bacterium]
MKKITLLLLLGLFVFVSSAQKQSAKDNLPKAQLKATGFNTSKMHAQPTKSIKAGGDVLYSYDFADVTGWEFGTIGVGTNEYQVGSPTTNMTDYMGDLSDLVNADETPFTSGDPMLYVDGITFLLTGDYQETNTFATTPTMDFSSVSGVLVKWKQIFKKYNGDEPYLEISTDGGLTWPTSLLLFPELTVNTYGERDHQINITDYVAGESNVKVRFRWFGPELVSGQGMYGSGYGWQIDDVEFIEAYQYDAILLDNQIHMGYTNGGYFSMVPTDQIMYVSYEGMVVNNGLLDLSNVTLTADVNEGLWVADSTVITWASGLNDSFSVLGFMPDAGTLNYSAVLTLSSDEVDEDGSNNELIPANFQLTTGVYARDISYDQSSGVGNYSDGADGDVMGVNYWVANDATINSVAVYIDPATTAGTTLIGYLFDADNNAIVTTEEFDITTDLADNGGWAILPFIEEVGGELNILAGDYTAGVEFYFGTDTLEIGQDKSNEHYWNIETALRIGDTWYYISQMPMIRLNLEGYDAGLYVNSEIVENNIFGVNVYPNPASTQVQISYKLKDNSNVSIEIFDITGKSLMKKNENSRVAGENISTINTSSLSNGVYYCAIVAGDYKVTKKVIIAK